MIPQDFQPRMHAYIAQVFKAKGLIPIAVGGVEDHVHALVIYNLNVSLPDVMRAVKANSSKMINESGRLKCLFRWQTGYGCFSISPGHTVQVEHYIRRQQEHHHNPEKPLSFEEELKRLFGLYKVDYVPEYMPKPEG